MTVCLQAVSKHPGFKTKTKGLLVLVESGLVGDSGVELSLQWSTRIDVYTRNPLKEGQAGVSGWEMAAQGSEG